MSLHKAIKVLGDSLIPSHSTICYGLANLTVTLSLFCPEDVCATAG